MRNSSTVLIALVMAAGLPACATKGYVNRNVKSVDDKVETLSGSLEETQARTKKNEEAIGQVDQRATAGINEAKTSATSANTAATRAQQSADGATTAATTAASAAAAADAHAGEVDKNAKRLVFTVVLSDDEGNFKSGDNKLPEEAKAKIDSLVSQLMPIPRARSSKSKVIPTRSGQRSSTRSSGSSALRRSSGISTSSTRSRCTR